MGYNGDLYPTAGASVVMTTKGDMVDYDTERQRLGIGSTGQVLTVASSLPAWSASATSVLSTTGDLLYASGANTLARLAGGTSGDVLTANGAGVAPSYQTPAGGGGKYEQLYQNSASGGGSPQVITATFSPALTLANYSNVLAVLTAYETSTGTNDIIVNLNGITSSSYSLQGITILSGSATYRNSHATASWIVKGNEAVPFWQLVMNIALPHNTYTAMTYQYSGKRNGVSSNQYNAGGGYMESVASNDIDEIRFEFQGAASVRETELTIYGLAQ